MPKKPSSTAERVITQRELNRALLARQFLIERVSMPVMQMVETLAGMQAQEPTGAYIGLWTRLSNFTRDDLAALIESRQIVKATLMRATLHFFTADDYVRFRTTLQPTLTAITESWARSHHLSVPFEPILSAAREALDGKPHTIAELASLLTGLFPQDDQVTLTNTVRGIIPLVQVPDPSQRWSFPRKPQLTPAEAWVGRSLSLDDNLHELVRRYLAAFGPATISDLRAWSGLPNLKALIAPFKAELVTYRDEQGRELLDLPDMPLPDPDTPVPVRFMGELDNLLLAHHDRTRVISADYRLLTVSARYEGRCILVDGFVWGSWLTDPKRPGLLMIEPFEPISKADQAALIEEGERLIRFIDPDAPTYQVQFLAVPESIIW